MGENSEQSKNAILFKLYNSMNPNIATPYTFN